jgi:hypothetical protein
MRSVVHGVCEMSRLGKPSHWCGTVFVVACCCALTSRGETGAAPPRWKTGAELDRALNARVRDIVWSAGTPVRQAVTALARTQGVAIMLDRRLDPGSDIELSVRDVPVREVIEQLAAQCGAAPAYLDGVVYVGPRSGTSPLAMVAKERRAEAQRLPRPMSQRLTAERAWRWDDLAEPRDLIDELAREAGITLEGTAQLPHDLWPAMDLPALAWTDRMTLVLSGFGLTFALADGGQSARLVPIPERTLVSRMYPATLPPSRVDAIKAQFPQATIEAGANRIELLGTPEEHERLQQLLRRQTTDRPPSRAAGKTVLTLKVASQPVEAILATLERQLGVTFQFDAGLEERLRTRVSLDVYEVALPELLDAALVPAGLSHRRQGDVIVISIKP